MSWKIKRISAAFVAACVWCLCSGAGICESHNQEVETGEEAGFLFTYGDVVGFIGDSITHVEYLPVSYVELLENYYLAHYPEQEIEFRNLGMAGYTVRDILEVYDRDPAFRGINKAVIMLGMNEAMQKIPTEEYLVALEELIGRLKADGLSGEDILVLAPTPYDQTCGINYDRNGFPYQTTDTRLQEFVAELPGKTTEWGVRYVDLHTPMRELSLEIQKENDRETLTVGDCIHPDLEGHWMMVYEILKAQGADFSGDLREERLEFYSSGQGQCWRWKTGKIGIAEDEGLERLCSIFPEAAGLTQGRFGGIGLSPDTSYVVTVDGEEFGAFQGNELETGIDLSAVDGAEELFWNDIAKQVAGKNQERHHNSAVYRATICALRAENPDFSEADLQEFYESWRAEDERLREEIHTLVWDALEREYAVSITEEGYPVEELWQEAQQVAEQARKEEVAREAAKQFILWMKKKIFIFK